MSSSKEAILMSKLTRKKAPSLSAADQYNDGKDFRGMKDGAIDQGPGLSANTGGSLDLLKSYKAGNIGGNVPSAARIVDNPVMKSSDIEDNAQIKAKKMPYSPIKNYLKKGK